MFYCGNNIYVGVICLFIGVLVLGYLLGFLKLNCGLNFVFVYFILGMLLLLFLYLDLWVYG